MASIREVAKLAGVSPATVSRVMNGTANVDSDKRERVLRAIDETGFKPNELARALFKKSSKIIGVIIPDIENPFFSELANVIEKEAYKNGYKLVLCNAHNDKEKELQNIDMLNQMKADGIIIMTNNENLKEDLRECGVPFVILDRKIKGMEDSACIETDNYKGGVLATKHLVECGCKNIVCMRGPQKFSSAKNRFIGYEDICKELNIDIKFVESDYDYEFGMKSAKEILTKYPEVDGVIACNDMAAIGAYKVFVGNGYKIPEDIQLIGFDNIRLSHMLTPELTTINQPIDMMGIKAVEIIIRQVEDKDFDRENIIDVQLVKRNTTK